MVSERLREVIAATLIVFLALAGAHAQDRAPHYAGRPLSEVLRLLQDRGLRIIFTSALVGRDLRVHTEPRVSTPRQQLDEMLAPHGLAARDGPGGVIQIVRGHAQPAAVLPSSRARVHGGGMETHAAAMPRIYSELVTVKSPPSRWPDHGVVSELRAADRRTQLLPAGLVDDPTRSIQALPRVASVDDFRSAVVVRASPFRHAEMVVDGVGTPWLRHTAHARGDSGSVSILSTHVLDAVMLRAGAYPRRYGDRLGPQLELTLREGSRERSQLSGSIGGTNATLVGEGPLGRAARGLWLVAVRQSFLEWPREHVAPRARRSASPTPRRSWCSM